VLPGYYDLCAVHAQWCVVFAQLMMDGKNQGIHGSVVRCVITILFVMKVLQCATNVLHSSSGYDGRQDPGGQYLGAARLFCQMGCCGCYKSALCVMLLL
jgi:hypothetical protein